MSDTISRESLCAQLATAIEQDAPAFVLKPLIKSLQQTLYAELLAGESINDILSAHIAFVDQALQHIWLQNMGEFADQLSLIAIGGTGRQALFPGSDLDLLIFASPVMLRKAASAISGFVSAAWDLGFVLGHSVHHWRSLITLIADDLDSYTAVLEGRYLAGCRRHAQRIFSIPDLHTLWPPVAFFEGKKAELVRRYEKARGTAYNLEPNIKSGSGALRDIHLLRWVGTRLYGLEGFAVLVDEGVITAEERVLLLDAERSLSAYRFALHSIAGRGEDRLLFSWQKSIAEAFGFVDTDRHIAVEHFMQDYFRQIWQVRCLTEMVLQHFEEVIGAQADGVVIPINSRFQQRGGFIEARNQRVFKQDLTAIFELFLLMQQDESIAGVRSGTIRLLREAAADIDDNFIHNPEAARLFLSILQQPTRVTRVLRRLHRYGILGRYIPEFAPLVGQMQFDMFHSYTVDQHTIFVVRNLRRLMEEKFTAELPFVSGVMRKVEKKWLVLIAGFFHDIGKGQGGDHSTIGADYVERFGRRLRLREYDIELLRWLVVSHLLMSMTAQKKDIDDPRVIRAFADNVQSEERLNYLYVLTVSDIRGTNPELWNGWKDMLLQNLYRRTCEAFRYPSQVTIQERAGRTMKHAKQLLMERGLERAAINEVWRRFPDEYFYRFSPSEVDWHTDAIARQRDKDKTVVLSRYDEGRAATEIMVYALDKRRLFASIATQLAKLNLNICDARIISSNFQPGQDIHHNYALNSYTVLTEYDEAIKDRERLRQISSAVRRAVNDPEQIRIGGFQRLSRSMREFDRSVHIRFSFDCNNNHTVLELETMDAQGLMAMVGLAFTQCDIRVYNARISTLGDKAEDMFWIADDDGQPLTTAAQAQLRAQIQQQLSELYGWDVVD